MKEKKWAYLAGFIDGDGCINGQLIRDKTYKRKWKISLTITLYQNKKRKWYMDRMKKELDMGFIRDRKDGMLEITIKSKKEVKEIVEKIQPYLIIKKAQANLILEIMKRSTETDEEFIEVCKMIDKFGTLNDSKKRKNTSIIVEKELAEAREAEAKKNIHP